MPAIATLLLGVTLVWVDPDIAVHARTAALSLFPQYAASLATYVLSEDPVVVYIKDFVTAEEAAHLAALAYALFVGIRGNGTD